MVFVNPLKGQSKDINMKFFVPETNQYGIYYPENFTVYENYENDEQIVAIYNETDKIYISISIYASNENFAATSIIDILNGYFRDYFLLQIPLSEFKEYKTTFDNLIEVEFTEKVKDNFWVWWAVSKRNKLIIISLNKPEEITESNINLLRFMIDNLTIF